MIDQEIINRINRIPIFDIMNVKGYCVVIEGQIRTFVFAADIAREAGLISIHTDSRRPIDPSSTNPTQLRTTSGAQFYQHNMIRWDRFNHYVELSLDSFSRINPNILPLIQLPIHTYSYIPCELALVVLMHCKSKKALDFQVTLATLIMPKIQQDTINYYEEQIQIYKDYIGLRHDDINNFISQLKELVSVGAIPYLINFIRELDYLTDASMIVKDDKNGQKE